MNKYQRIVLIIGAVAFLISLWTAPRVQYGPQGTVWKADEWSKEAANVIDYRTALARGIGVLGATGIIWFSLSKIRGRDKS